MAMDLFGEVAGRIGFEGGNGEVVDVKVKTTSQYESVLNPEDKTAYIDLSGYAKENELSEYVTSDGLSLILANYVTSTSLSNILNDYVTDNELSTELSNYQPKLIAGDNITIEDNVISASGGGAVNYSTTEQLTGKKWIDGVSDVYQRTFVSNTTLAPNNYIILDSSMLSGNYTFFTVKNVSLKYVGSDNYYGLNSIAGNSIDVALHPSLGLFVENYTSNSLDSIVITCEYVKS